MNFKFFLPVLMLAIFALSLALHAGSVKSETASYPSGTDTISGYLVLPDGGGKHPAIIVIHEWWGLNDWVKEQTQKYAGQGYVALAVDLYRGKVATTPDDAHILMRGLAEDRGLRDLQAAFPISPHAPMSTPRRSAPSVGAWAAVGPSSSRKTSPSWRRV